MSDRSQCQIARARPGVGQVAYQRPINTSAWPSLLASALTQPAEVIGIATGAVTVRALVVAFICLAGGGSRRAVTEEFGVAFVASLPFGALVAIALTVYLVLGP